MNTFLPYHSFSKSAMSLDNKRLNKQIVECYQILKALKGETKGWKNHPCTLMWKGYESTLAEYGIWCCYVWKERGFKTKLEDVLYSYFDNTDGSRYPWWLGLNEFHESHRSNLHRKDCVHYNSFDEEFEKDLPYCWPIEIDGIKYLRYKHVGEKAYRIEEYK